MLKQFKEPAIIFGGGINGLGIIRNLGTLGIKVYCITERIDPATFSKACHKRILIPHYKERIHMVKSFLQDFSRTTTSRPVIFATDDIGTLMLSKLADNCKDDYNFVVPRPEVAKKLIVKTEFYNSLEKASVPFPRVFPLTSPGRLESLKNNFHYPLFIRPSISPRFVNVFKKKGFIAKNNKELTYYYNLATKHKIDVLFQEIIFGPDTNQYGISGLFGRTGKPLAFFAYHRLRSWPPMFGNSSLMESYPLEELSEIQSILMKYLTDLGFCGIMDAEIKRDIKDNQFKVLEVNARSWWQNSFPTKCGQNIILKAYLDAIGRKIGWSEEYITGIKWLDALSDVFSAIQNMEVLRLRWFKSLKNIKDFAFFDVSDPLPFLSRPLCVLATNLGL